MFEWNCREGNRDGDGSGDGSRDGSGMGAGIGAGREWGWEWGQGLLTVHIVLSVSMDAIKLTIYLYILY